MSYSAALGSGGAVESFRIDGNSVRDFSIRVDEVTDVTPDLVQILLEIDLQTFAESTYSTYTAAAFFRMGRVFLLRADEVVIGTCVCFRSWDRPNEAMLLSMGIRPGWRGRGLGQRFVTGVLDRLRSRGLRSVALLVGKENRRAIKVYADVGFHVVDERLVDPDSVPGANHASRDGETLVLMRTYLQTQDHAPTTAGDSNLISLPPTTPMPPPVRSDDDDP